MNWKERQAAGDARFFRWFSIIVVVGSIAGSLAVFPPPEEGWWIPLLVILTPILFTLWMIHVAMRAEKVRLKELQRRIAR